MVQQDIQKCKNHQLNQILHHKYHYQVMRIVNN